MRVLIMSANHLGSEYYRVTEPVRAVRELGADVEVVVRTGLSTRTVQSADGGEPQVVSVDAEGADVVVLQLPKSAGMLRCIELLQAQGVAVVVEMDDLLSGVPFGSPAYSALVTQGMGRRALECAQQADLVTVSTLALLTEYARHGRGVVVPNAVPRRIAELPPAYEREPDVVTVGWTGSAYGHPYDLQEMGSGLQQALDRTRGRSRFAVLGQKGEARALMGLTDEPTEVPWLHDVDAYATVVGELFDVGIAPLRLDRFNACKSWLKALEYSARGVACVRAASPEYDRLGLGWRARAPRDWAKWTAVAIEDPQRRRDQAAAAHAAVLAGHLTEHVAERWVDAWRSARETRSRSRRKGA